ncbi:solute carrier family 35 member C2-like isoform X1 [Pseudomyrmex gracilis]|uniref:solute carrier family 35 member C2-like isoform X1 n=1 Tax=Pseudomyrmex gracilis TaxID=219809 RepID=UPI0009953490|nr:solute carrier family 35 member C2-like isoform X1 [Pseudomyrmex gracilis]XP_020293965.1 solute carrier family 35 member C2-like isoform X1 [Pseudomyrmex gracilis]XP_020293966.1 solute carrier family 35 member C2-like isoform X1 [Pseudomyrmex gracilis]XP_020293967.1 solute carrier family 35 member C2-like isoform X1 [Pseudomyrmex gracilis]
MTRSHIKYQIARDDVDTTEYLPQSVTDFQNATKPEPTFWRKAFQAFVLISIYFILSIGLTFYNPWLYNTYGFDFPLGVVVCHLVIKFILSALIRCIRRCCNVKRINLPWQSIIYSLMVPGIASGVDIGLSNWALSLISISLVTMTKSTVIIFILGFSLLFKLEKKSWSLVGIVVMIAGGLVMFTYKSTQFGVLGFILCLLASFASGIRWTMTQLIMQRSKLGLHDPIDMMYYMQPWMLLPAVSVALWFEGGKMYNGINATDWSDIGSILSTTSTVIAGAILAFSMEIMEFLVVTHTSSLTLSISGVFKEICTLTLAFALKGDQMTGLNFVGLLMCLGGIIIHVVQKVLVNRKKTIENLELQSKVTSNSAKQEEGTDSNMPLLMEKSTSLVNLLNAEFSSDEDGNLKEDENAAQILSDILQRREHTQ